MTATILTIKDGLMEIFPEMGEMQVTPEVVLGDIPDWDSMSSINLQMYLEQEFSVSVPHDLLHEDATIGDIITVVEG